MPRVIPAGLRPARLHGIRRAISVMAKWWSIEVPHGEFSAFRWQEQLSRCLNRKTCCTSTSQVLRNQNLSAPGRQEDDGFWPAVKRRPLSPSAYAAGRLPAVPIVRQISLFCTPQQMDAECREADHNDGYTAGGLWPTGCRASQSVGDAGEPSAESSVA